MTAYLASIALIAQGSPAPSGSEMFSKMLQKYHEAKSVRGTITFNQTATGGSGEAKVSILTSVQWSEPNLFYLEQTRQPQSNDPETQNHFLAVSDGKRMHYTLPKAFLPWTDATSGKHSQFYEAAPKTISGALDTFCALILDRSLPISVALYNPYEIELTTKKLSNIKADEKEVEVSGKPAYRISADVRKARKNAGDIAMPMYFYIDKDYNLLGVVFEENVSDGPPTNNIYKITSQWVVNLQVNTDVDKSLFVVR